MLPSHPRPSSSSVATPKPRFPFDHSYARLPERFFSRLEPTPVAAPRLIVLNRPLAAELRLELEALDDETLARIFSGNQVPEGALPLAQAYAGHQFGQFVPQLGDGRALLLGELLDRGGRRRDLQLKGSGGTPYSRNGDGRAALGPVLREYLVSEAMHALGIPTTRALAAVGTGEYVYRERPLPGAVLTRVAASHVRVGTFQFFAARGDGDAVKRLADHVIERLYPDIASADDPYLELLRAVMCAQAELVARWMCVGFIHGVMNTDNMSISGETLDFGPCAFLDDYDPKKVFSSIDSFGRYAFENQPAAAHWNLARFAEALLALIDSDPGRAVERATLVLNEFPEQFARAREAGMRAKLGLATREEGDDALIEGWLSLLNENHADFTQSFRDLCTVVERLEAGAPAGAAGAGGPAGNAGTGAQIPAPAAPGVGLLERESYRDWEHRFSERLARERAPPGERARRMRRTNPAYIPRNHRIEQMIDAAILRSDFGPFRTLLEVLAQPFEERAQYARFAMPPQPEERVLHTFCGT